MSIYNLPEIKTGYAGIHDLLFAGYLPKILNTAIDAGVFEALTHGGLETASLARKLGTDPGATAALCRILVHVSLLETEDEKFSLSPMGREFLVADSPVNQLADVNEYPGAPGPFDALGDVLKGKHVPEFNDNMWATKKKIQAMAQGAKAGSIQAVISFITSLPEFENMNKMCDLAGNSGHYARALTQCNRGLNAHVYDLAEVVKIAQQLGKEDDRVVFHSFDMEKNDDFGQGYDLFFISHFLYKHGGDGSLSEFFKKVNRAMVSGGVFVSNHIPGTVPSDRRLTMDMVELLTMCMGYPTHHLPVEILEQALEESGFGNFTLCHPGSRTAYPELQLAARKLREV